MHIRNLFQIFAMTLLVSYLTVATATENYIEVKFKKEVKYTNGFSYIEHDRRLNEFRTQVSSVKYKDTDFNPKAEIDIKENSEIKIFFSNPIKDLKNFFHNFYDPNTEYIISVDFSNFDSSLLESVDSLFYGCISLELINLSQFNAPCLTNMDKMFFSCISLKSIDLSNTQSASIKNMNRIFCGCISLEYLIIDNLNMENLEDNSFMFYNVKQLEYLSIINIKKNTLFSEEINGKYGLNNINDLTVCQKSQIVNSDKAIYGCYNFDISSLTSENYMLVKYKSLTTYRNGFQNSYRENIAYIIYQNYSLSGKDGFKIHENSTIEIHFLKSPNSLMYFFERKNDINVENIISIDLSHFDSSSVTDMTGMFYNCRSLISLNLSNFNTSSVTDMTGMFYNCRSLISLNLSSFDTSRVTYMTGVFSNCTSLISLNLSSFDTSRTIDMMSSFRDCHSLISLNLSNFNTSSLTYAYGMFQSCHSLISLNLSNFDTSSVTDMSYMFYDCRSLIFLDISNFNFTIVQSLYAIVHKDDNLKYINLYGIINYTKLAEEVSFSNYLYYGNIVCQESNQIVTSQYAIYRCFDFDNYILVKYKSLTEYENGFYNTYRKDLAYIIYQNKILSVKESFKIQENSTIEIHFLYSPNSLAYFFGKSYDSNVENITSIDFSHFNSLSVSSMKAIFYGCSSLESLNLSNFKTSSVTDMEAIFNGCSSLISLNLSNFITSSVTNMAGMFYKCSSLISLNLSNFITSSVTTMARMFYECSSLISLDISNFDFSKKPSLEQMFYGVGLKYIGIKGLIEPAFLRDNSNFNSVANTTNIKVCQTQQIITSVTSRLCSDHYMVVKYKQYTEYNNFFNNKREDLGHISYKNKKIYANEYFAIEANTEIELHFLKSPVKLISFFSQYNDQNVVNIISVDLSHFNSSAVTNVGNMFELCKSLISIDLTNFDTSSMTSMQGMFSGCNSLISLDLSNFDTSSVKDMKSMFFGCYLLTSLNLSNFNTSSVTSMFYIFHSCNSLKSLDLSNFDTSSVTDMSYMFYNCISLMSLDISNFDFNKVQNVLHIFYNDTKLKYIKLYGINNYNKLKSENSFKNYVNDARNIIVCQDNTIVNNESAIYRCFDNDNYILVKYKSLTEYISFTTYYRKDLAYIIYENKILSVKESFKIQENSEIEIHFLYSPNSLKNFFNIGGDDDKVKNIIFIDFSHFNSSSVTDMEGMFKGCNSLISLNLSNFDTSSVTNMEGMFNGCSSLIFLDISNFDFSNVIDLNDMFYGTNHIKYILLKNINNYEKLKDESSFNDYVNTENIIVCQDNPIVNNESAIYKCCVFDIQTQTCNNLNFVIVYYKNDITYENGFQKINNQINNFRKDISFIRTEDGQIKTSGFSISSGIKIEIHLSFFTKSLSHFFDTEYDTNAENLAFVDFSNFDSSLITDMNSLFKGCKSLENIIISNLNTSSVNNMNSMFYGCTELKYLDISNFNTLELVDVSEMFSGCSSLLYLDISNFDMIKIQYSENIFNEVNNLEYINILHVNNSYNNITNSIINNIANLNVCQNELLIDNKNIVNICGYYNLESKTIESTNYIKKLIMNMVL